MALVHWDPWHELATLQRDVNARWERAFSGAGALVPPVDAYRTDSGLSVRMELPGMQPEDVEVSVADGRLKVSGERRVDEKIEEGRWVRRERAIGRFQRTFALPRGVDAESITASFENGILQLEIPHTPDQQPRKIAVTAAASDPQQA